MKYLHYTLQVFIGPDGQREHVKCLDRDFITSPRHLSSVMGNQIELGNFVERSKLAGNKAILFVVTGEELPKTP